MFSLLDMASGFALCCTVYDIFQFKNIQISPWNALILCFQGENVMDSGVRLYAYALHKIQHGEAELFLRCP